MPPRSLLQNTLLAAAALAALPAAAGLSLEQMQERHRALIERADGDTYRTPAEARSMVAAQAGRRPSAAPALIDDELYGAAGLAATYTLLDRETAPLGIELRLGAVVDDDIDGVRLHGSRASVPLGPGRAYASYEQRHWGPGWFGSLILDGAARPVAAAGWRTAGGEGGGHWQADLFAGTLRGHSDPADPKLIGMRLEWRPTSAWTIGLARAMQWGGDGRTENARTFFNALVGRDNSGDIDVGSGNEPGNQLAGGDIRYSIALGESRSLGVYGQVIGEDFSGVVPSRRMWMVGADGAADVGPLSLRGIVELADTTAGKARGLAYRHHIYKAGYTHRGHPLGHPIGGDARLVSAGLLFERGAGVAMLAASRGRALVGAQRFVAGDALHGAEAALSYDLNDRATLGVSAHYWSAGDSRDRWALAWAEYRWP